MAVLQDVRDISGGTFKNMEDAQLQLFLDMAQCQIGPDWAE